MSEQTVNIVTAEHHRPLDKITEALAWLSEKDSELAGALEEARQAGSILSGVDSEAIAATNPPEGRGSSLALTYQLRANRALLQVKVSDWIEGDPDANTGPTSVTGRLRIMEDGEIRPAGTHLRYTDGPRKDKVSPHSPDIKRRDRKENGKGDPAKIRAFAIGVARKIVEQSRNPELQDFQ